MSKSNKEEKKAKYYPADNEKIQKKLEELGTGTFFKAKEGKNIIRILPPWSKEGVWYKEATLHYGLQNDSGKERAYPCLQMFGKDCPICNKKDEFAQGGEEDKKIAERLRPRTKYYANVMDRATGKVMIWGFSAKTLSTLLSYTSDPDYGDISDPEEGFDLVIERQGTGRTDTRYQIRMKPKPTEVDMDEVRLFDLDKEVIEEKDEEELEELIEQNFGEAVSKKSKKKKDEDDDDSDDEEDEEDKDEDEEDSKERNKKKKGKVKEDDDDDEDKED